MGGQHMNPRVLCCAITRDEGNIMGFIRAIAFCPTCNTDVVFARVVCPLWVHVLMTTATLGAWLLAAPLARLHRSQWRCSHCGAPPITTPLSRKQTPHYGLMRPHEASINQVLIGQDLVYYLPTNAAFGNTDHPVSANS